MPAVSFVGCITTGHGCWHPTIIAGGVGTLSGVLTSMTPVAVWGDFTVPHCCPFAKVCTCHWGKLAGPNSVLVNMRPLQTLGMPIICCGMLDFIAMGNPTVLCGGF